MPPKGALWSVRGQVMRWLCHSSRAGGLRLGRGRSLRLRRIFDGTAIGESAPHGLARLFSLIWSPRRRALDIILNRTNLLVINVTNKTIGIQFPTGRSTGKQMGNIHGLPKRCVWSCRPRSVHVGATITSKCASTSEVAVANVG